MSTLKNKGLLGVGVITAIASSLCCITPVLALLSGTGGMTSTFSGLAWWLKLRPTKEH